MVLYIPKDHILSGIFRKLIKIFEIGITVVLDKCLKNTPVQFLPFAMLGYLDICKGTILGVQNLTLYCNKIDSAIQLFLWVYKSSLAEEQTLDLFFLYAIETEI